MNHKINTFEMLYGQELVEMAKWFAADKPELKRVAKTLQKVGEYLLEIDREGIHR